MENKQQHTFIYKFLISNKFRIWRHVLLILGILLISTNQTFGLYQKHLNVLGPKLYVIIIGIGISYLIPGYLNLYVLIPRYLLKKKYIQYGVTIILSVCLVIIIQDMVEYMSHTLLDLVPNENSILNPDASYVFDFLSAYAMCIICFTGVSVTVLLKKWMVENRRVSKLEKEYLQSEVEQLKGQISPSFLFKILNRTGSLAVATPEISSDMLMKLSQILRYQLYDSAREDVLLSSEITFLRNYLNLQQTYSGNFKYRLSVIGDVSRIMLPPLLFIQFVQYLVDIPSIRQEINIHFEVKDNMLFFSCSDDEKALMNDDLYLSDINRRLEFLYPDRYRLNYEEDRKIITLQLNLL